MSAAFKGDGEKLKTGKKAARCHELKAVDCVTDPAANKGGLFSASAGKVDTHRAGMADANNLPANTQQTQEPTLADVLAVLNQVSQRLDAIEAANAPEPTLEEIAALSDDELGQIGLTRAEVDAAVAQAQAALAEGDPNANVDSDPASAAATGAQAATALSAQVKKEVMLQFSALKEQEANRHAVEAAEHAFGVIEQKVTELEKAVGEKDKELASKDAEIKQLQLAARQGRKPVQAGHDVDFSASSKPKEGTYEFVVKQEYDRLVAAGKTPVQAKAAAYEFGVKRHPELHSEWRAKGAQEIRLGA